MTFSQAGEQRAIVEWADGRVGSFLDIGAYDGWEYSNTAGLAQLGWGGLCIDAAPDAAAECAVSYRHRDDIDVLLAVFDTTLGASPVRMHWSPGEMYTSPLADRREGVAWTDILVPRVDLAWLALRVEMMPRPLFVSIDIEGGSIAALGWVLLNLAPDCVCVEANNPRERKAVRSLTEGWTDVYENDWNIVVADRPGR